MKVVSMVDEAYFVGQTIAFSQHVKIIIGFFGLLIVFF